MKDGQATAELGIIFLKWELLVLVPFFIFHSPFLTLRVFVSSRQNSCEKCGLAKAKNKSRCRD